MTSYDLALSTLDPSPPQARPLRGLAGATGIWSVELGPRLAWVEWMSVLVVHSHLWAAYLGRGHPETPTSVALASVATPHRPQGESSSLDASTSSGAWFWKCVGWGMRPELVCGMSSNLTAHIKRKLNTTAEGPLYLIILKMCSTSSVKKDNISN